MTDKVPTPVSGNPDSKGAPDGVSGSPRGTDRDIDGRKGGGESEGGAYPNPHTGKAPEGGGFMGHGGQTEMAYHGGGQAGDDGGSAPNAVTGSNGDGDVDGSTGVAQPEPADRDVQTDGGTVAVEETSGTAAAEATGKVGTDAAYDDEQKHPGSG
ncbi:hypothetical protein [Sphingomonas sp. R86521]|uniref:hypothetical protein n=1 Tax=Sphingomonas sp. R86521 TaxID=3093860 RepID=UPI0036D3DF14